MIGRKIAHYCIAARLGEGGMGVVYRARDQRLERDVALKVLSPGLIADDAARRRFRKEALALSTLNHPNIQTVHDFDTEGDVDFSSRNMWKERRSAIESLRAPCLRRTFCG
jgi:serine/threonine protein kinase